MGEPTNNFRNAEEEEKMVMIKEKNIERRSKTVRKKECGNIGKNKESR